MILQPNKATRDLRADDSVLALQVYASSHYDLYRATGKEDPLGIGKQPDRRQFGRRPVFKAAVAVQADGRRLPGFILDFSDAGARIKISKPDLVEKEFYLEIPDDDFIVKCRVVHVDEVSIGVKYIKPPRRISWLNR